MHGGGAGRTNQIFSLAMFSFTIENGTSSVEQFSKSGH
jgi:hypothetical protein